MRDLVIGSPHRFEDRGSHELKGVPGLWPVLAHVGEQDTHDPRPGVAPELRVADRAVQFVARRVPALGRATSRLARGRVR